MWFDSSCATHQFNSDVRVCVCIVVIVLLLLIARTLSKCCSLWIAQTPCKSLTFNRE